MNIKKIVNESDLLNVQSAADFLGVNPGTIRRWAQNNQLIGVKVGIRGDWRFKKNDLLKMSNSNEVILPFHEELQTVPLNLPMSILERNKKPEHIVQFYANDSFLITAVRDYLLEGDSAIVVATPTHRANLEQALLESGFDINEAYNSGQYISLDAQETFSKFMVNGLPDPALFFEVIGGLISKAVDSRKQVRVFGEMVALLWEEGNQSGAIRLEELWNELQKIHSFSLFCGYHLNNFNDGSVIPFNQVCTAHSHVLPGEGYTSLKTTDEKLREVALLQQKASSLEAEIAKRKKLEKQKDEFISLASHELKTPVTSLKVYAQVLQKQFQKEGNMKSASYLTKMEMQINKLTTLIEDLLDVTKSQRGILTFHEDFFSINELAAEVIEELQRTTQNHSILKEGDIDEMVYGDRERIGQVLTNLLSNAIKYSPNSDYIVVTLSSDKEEIKIGVQDFGVGIAQEELVHVFKQFYREPGVEQDTYPGLGLGLFISSEIVKRHGGKIWVESEKGKGSQFWVSLPLKNISKTVS